MEMPGRCAACGEDSVVVDAIHGVLACDACGTVGNHTETELRSEFQTGHVIERRGTYVGESDSGVAAARGLMRGHFSSHSFFSGYPCWSERHRLETMKKVESITALLRVPVDKVDQAKQLLESTLNGDWGTGRWVDILVAACVYIVIRQCQLPLTIPEVADCVNCDVIELGRMYNRVLVQKGISLPNVDGFIFLERAASTLPALKKLNKDLVRKMKSQAKVLLDYAQECFIMTGRRPLPVVAAVLSLVVEANQVVIGIADVTRHLHAGMWATKKRYKEFQVAMIGLGQSLPWGRDITLKTVPRHLPFLLKYLELKVKLEKEKRKACPEGKQPFLCPETSSDGPQPSIVPRISLGVVSNHPVPPRKSDFENSSAEDLPNFAKQSFENVFSGQPARATLTGSGDTFKSICSKRNRLGRTAPDDTSAPLLHERSGKLLKITELARSGGGENVHCRSDGSTSIEINFSSVDIGHEREEYNSEITRLPTQDSLSQFEAAKIASEQVSEECRWEGLPAAFSANQEARTRRRAKIDVAKNRIVEARNRLNKRCEEGSVDASFSVHRVQEQSKPNTDLRKEPSTTLGWEDLLIEYLILRGASEAELENGYYQSLLALYPKQQDTELVDDDDPTPYFRSRSEVELLLEITGRRGGGDIIHCPVPLASVPPQ